MTQPTGAQTLDRILSGLSAAVATNHVTELVGYSKKRRQDYRAVEFYKSQIEQLITDQVQAVAEEVIGKDLILTNLMKRELGYTEATVAAINREKLLERQRLKALTEKRKES